MSTQKLSPSSHMTSTSTSANTQGASDEDVCRVCRSEGSSDDPLFYPCKCSGSIRYVHQDCLIEWLNHSQKKHCELCKTSFQFTKLYDPAMPKRLPTKQLLTKVLCDIQAASVLCLRWSLVAFIWLGWLPYCTRHIWRSSIRVGDSLTTKYALSSNTNTFTTNNETLASQMLLSNATNTTSSFNSFLPFDLTGITSSEMINKLLVEIMEGQVITSVIIVIFVVVFLIREWIVQNNANLLAEAPQFILNRVENEEHPRIGLLDDASNDDLRLMRLASGNSDIAEPRTLIPLQELSSETSDWDNLRAQANLNRREQSISNEESSSPSAQADNLNQSMFTTPGESGSMNSSVMNSMTANEQRAINRQAVLRATTERLEQIENRSELHRVLNEVHGSQAADVDLNVPNPAVRHLDQLIADQHGEPSADHLRHRIARRRSAERKVWEQTEAWTGEVYPDSPMPVPTPASDNIKPLLLPPGTSSLSPSPVPITSAPSHEESAHSQEILRTLEDAPPMQSSPPPVRHQDRFDTAETTTTPSHSSLSQGELDLLLEQIRAAPNSSERTNVANAAIQVCIDAAQLLQPGLPLDRADPIYREAIRQVGLIAMIANESGIDRALDVERAFRLAEQLPTDSNTEADAALPTAVERPVIQIPGLDQNGMRQLQADVANAEADRNIARDDMDDDFEGLLEVIGVRGPVIALLKNSMLVVVMISGFIFFGVCMPYIFGRLARLILREPELYFIQFPITLLTTIFQEFRRTIRVAVRGAKVLVGPFVSQSRVMKYSFALTRFCILKTYEILLSCRSSHFSLASQRTERFQSFYDANLKIFHHTLLNWLKFSPLQSILPRLPEKLTSVIYGYTLLTITGSVYLQANRRMTSGDQGRQAELFIRAFLRQTGFVMKFIAILGIELIVFPFYCGLLLDLVLLPLFRDATLVNRLTFFSRFPFTGMFLHWLVGTIYMFNFALFVSMCREIVRPGLLFFIRDPNDPAFNPIKDILERSVRSQMRKIGISMLIYGGLILGALGSIVWAVTRSVENILPLTWGSSEPLFELPFDLLLFQILIPLTYRYVKPHRKIKAVWTNWFSATSRWLRLTSFIMGERVAEQEGHCKIMMSNSEDAQCKSQSEEFVRDGSFRRVPNIDSLPMRKNQNMIMIVTEDNRPVDKSLLTNDETFDDPNYTVVYAPPRFKLRIYLFMFCMWLFAAIFGVSVTVIPLVFGRKIFQATAPNTPVHDLFAYLYGLYALGLSVWILGLIARLKSFTQEITHSALDFARKPKEALRLLHVSATFAAKWIYLFSTLSIVIPTLLGLCLETYVIIPLGMWYNPEYVPTIHLVHDWVVGLIYVKIFGRTAIMLPTSRIGHALNGTIRNDWRLGWRNPDVSIATRRLVVPIGSSLIVALILPWSLGTLARQTLYSTASQQTVNFVYRMSYPVTLMSCLLLLTAKGVYVLAQQWRAKIRDSLYLQGRQLHNFGEAAPPKEKQVISPESMSSAASGVTDAVPSAAFSQIPEAVETTGEPSL